MDAGVGIKAYAVIEQGKIGQILSARPTDRRQLIEEAAGITKYKSRRRSAELKLEAAQQNLTRVDDIIFEVEKQRGALKRQAAKARRYKRLREELRRWEKVQFAQRYRLLGEAIEATRGPARRRARPRNGGRRSPGRGRDHAGAAAARADRGGLADDGGARSGARARAVDRAAAAAGRVRQAAGRDAAAPRPWRWSAEIEALEARREPARVELERAPRRGGTRGRRAPARRRGARRRRKRPTGSRTGRSKGSSRTSRRRAAKSTPRSTPRPRCATRWSTPPPRASASASSSASSTSSATICRSKRSAPPTSAPPPRSRCAGAREAMETLHVDRAARESELAVARGSREALGRDVRTREHELAGVAARLQVARGARCRPRRVRRRRAHDPGRVRRRRAAPRVGRRLRRGRPGSTSAPSTPPSAICSSTSSCARTRMRRPGSRSRASAPPGGSGSSSPANRRPTPSARVHWRESVWHHRRFRPRRDAIRAAGDIYWRRRARRGRTGGRHRRDAYPTETCSAARTASRGARAAKRAAS